MKSVTLKFSKQEYDRLEQEAKENNQTIEQYLKKEVGYEYHRLTEKDRKGTCHSGWYQGHRPVEPNDGLRAICSGCGKGLVKYGLFKEKWQLDKTKKALHLKQPSQKVVK